MAYVEKAKFVFDCTVCHTPCNGQSKGVYLFNNDAAFSEHYEQLIIQRINRYPNYCATKSVENGYPDITIKTNDGEVYRYLEVKVQQRTFMSIQKHLPASQLLPSETVALNLSDLLRYFEIEEQTGIATCITWVLLNRPCILNGDQPLFFYQKISNLKSIFSKEHLKRKFTRKSGEGDVVEGLHKGVTVNYHFSLKELLVWKF